MKQRTKIWLLFSSTLLLPTAGVYAQWANKVNAAATAGAAEINGVLDGVTSLLMALGAVGFLIGIGNAGFKYKNGDQNAFKSLQGVLIGSLVLLIGSGLAKILFF
jgi:hypothetical protein